MYFTIYLDILQRNNKKTIWSSGIDSELEIKSSVFQIPSRQANFVLFGFTHATKRVDFKKNSLVQGTVKQETFTSNLLSLFS